MLSVLQNRNYRLWLFGLGIANIGSWMQRTAQDWLILQLTHNSGTQLGLVTGVQFLPILVIGPIGGVLADRFSRRHLLMWSQAMIGLCGVVLAALVAVHSVAIWHVYVMAVALGVATAVFQPAVQAFVMELVTKDEVAAVVGFSGGSFHAARLVGPGVAGALIALAGTSPVFAIAGLTVVAPIVALLRMNVAKLHNVPSETGGFRMLFNGFRYAAREPEIRLLLLMAAVVGIFCANTPITSALMATTVFGKGAGEFGLLGSVVAVGSLAGAVLAARRKSVSWRLASVGAVAFCAINALSGLMPSYPWFAVVLVPVGLSQLTFITAANATLQLRAAAEIRGRVMALFIVLSMGTAVFGGPLIGAIAGHFGARMTLVLINVVAMVLVLVLLALHLWTSRTTQQVVQQPQEVASD